MRGVQFTGTVPAGATVCWLTFNWAQAIQMRKIRWQHLRKKVLLLRRILLLPGTHFSYTGNGKLPATGSAFRLADFLLVEVEACIRGHFWDSRYLRNPVACEIRE